MEMGERVKRGRCLHCSRWLRKTNDNLLELLFMINACKIAESNQVAVLVPDFPEAGRIRKIIAEP